MRAASGRPLNEGAVLATFPHIEDQIRFVYFGTAAYNIAGVESYGNPDREGGPHLAGSFGPMPAWGALAGGSLTDAQILAVVCHERYTLSGQAQDGDSAEEFEHWCSEEAPIFAALESGATLADVGGNVPVNDAEGQPIDIMPIGDAPAEGSPP